MNIGRQSISDRVDIRPLLFAIGVGICLAMATLPAPALAAPAPPPLEAPAATLVTMGGVPLWAHDANKRLRVASTIKMLNALVVRDRTQLTDMVTVPRTAAAIDIGDVGLVTGQRLTVHQLLRIMLIPSANDAAEALAIHIAGSEKAYVALMNAKAKSLGLKGTTAADPHGLSQHEYSTANDLAVLARRVMADPVLRAIVAERTVAVPQVTGPAVTVSTTNRLFGAYRGMEGVKTGSTGMAGWCFVGAAKRGGVELVGVVLDTWSVDARFSEMRTLLDWGFQHAHRRQIVSRTDTVSVMPAGTDVPGRVILHPVRSVSVTLLDGSPAVTESFTVSPPKLPLRAGQQIGMLSVRQGRSLLATVPLAVLVDVPAPATMPSAATTERSSGAAGRTPWDSFIDIVVGFWQRLAWGATKPSG